MVPLDHANLIEELYTREGVPCLGKAYSLLWWRWAAGGNDLETGLRLMFLAWYSLAESPFVTGLSPDLESASEVFWHVFDHFGGEDTQEPEVLYAAGVLASAFPWCLGDEREGVFLGRRWLAKFWELQPAGFPPEHFAGRGAYGQYFAQRITAEKNNGNGW
jgi:hypothetical protein